MKRYLYFLIFVSILSSCASSKYLRNQNLGEIYRLGENSLNPEFEVFHLNKDSSRLYFKINTEELLYKDPEGQGRLRAKFALYCTLFPSFDSNSVLDTTTTFFEHQASGTNSKFILQYLDFKIMSGKNYVLKIETRDLNRGDYYFNFIEIDKKNTESAQFYKICKPGSDIPLFRRTLSSTEQVVIIPSNENLKRLSVRYYDQSYPLAIPPFVAQKPDKFNFDPDGEYLVDIGADNPLVFEKMGIYYFYFLDTLVKERFSIFRFADDYPSITAPEQLIEPLRYITTNDEYRYLKTQSNPKDAVDLYWLDVAGSEARGKELIRNYYTRVQFANYYFTSYLEGWKSDRGLIYIVFGPPDKVFKTGPEEYWSYESAPYRNAINFTFERLYNPFSSNDYILQRSAVFEYPWYSTVEAWRQGRIVTGSF